MQTLKCLHNRYYFVLADNSDNLSGPWMDCAIGLRGDVKETPLYHAVNNGNLMYSIHF